MAEFTIRSESVDVEQIMRQIRSRIREKRGVDYTEDQIRELATVRLEKFLDPKNLRSDLLEQFRKSRPALPVEPLAVEAPYTSGTRMASCSIMSVMALRFAGDGLARYATSAASISGRLQRARFERN